MPVLSCADELRAYPVVKQVEIRPAQSDADIDVTLTLTHDAQTRLVVAGSDAIARAVVRRMVKRALALGGKSQRAGLAIDRTIPDLAPFALLPLDADPGLPDLARALQLPMTPHEVAAAVVTGTVRRLDLFRNDRGSVTLHGVLLGGAVAAHHETQGRPVAWWARIDVDDTALCDPNEPLLACAIGNATGYSQLGTLPLLTAADPTSGTVSVGLAVSVDKEIQVRRAHGRAVSIRLCRAPYARSLDSAADPPREQPSVPFTDDGVDGVLRHACTWWVERAAWALYTE
ncbi:MAG: hypothetical protein DLM55_03905 [Acidimicrobiales bacterium]|nr:MAG: hypothetical protein DLM55_03905 [Acidimicrobiales bacterium]